MKVCKGNSTLCPDLRIFSLFMYAARARLAQGMDYGQAMREAAEECNRHCEAIGCPHLKEIDSGELEGDVIYGR